MYFLPKQADSAYERICFLRFCRVHLRNSIVPLTVDTLEICIVGSRVRVSKKNGAAAAKDEGRKTRVYKSKVDSKTTLLFPAAIEMSGRWGEGLISLFKKGVSLATKEGKNTAGKFATL